MNNLYHTLSKKAVFNFIKSTVIIILVILRGFNCYSQTAVQTSAQAAPAIQEGDFHLSFYATLKNDAKVVLNWVASGSNPASHFIIQRSSDGTDFRDAAVLFTDNNSLPKKHYRYADNISDVDSGLLYYRIKTVGLDGKTEYSKVKTVKVEKKIEEQSITSNAINLVSDLAILK
jgi:hypothetical protein